MPKLVTFHRVLPCFVLFKRLFFHLTVVVSRFVCRCGCALCLNDKRKAD